MGWALGPPLFVDFDSAMRCRDVKRRIRICWRHRGRHGDLDFGQEYSVRAFSVSVGRGRFQGDSIAQVAQLLQRASFLGGHWRLNS